MRPEDQLATAILQKKKEAALALLGQNPGLLNRPLSTTGRAALHLAVISRSLEMVRALCEIKQDGARAIDINIRVQDPGSPEEGATAVYLASSNQYVPNNSAILTYLLEQKADLSLAPTHNTTPLIRALADKKWDRAQALILAGVTAERLNANAVNVHGTTALTLTIYNECSTALFQSVLAIPGLAIVNHKQNNGMSALFLAADYGLTDKVRALVEYPGIDLEAKVTPGDGRTAIQTAQLRGYRTIVDLITGAQTAAQAKAPIREFMTLVDMRAITADPLAAEALASLQITPPPTDVDKKQQQVAGRITPYSQWLKIQCKMPSPVLFTTYLSELKTVLSPEVTPFSWRGPFITATERSYIEARRTWTELISDMDRVNTQQNTDYILGHNDTTMQQAVVNRLAGLGYSKDGIGIYRDMVEYLQQNSAIVITFKADEILGQGFTDYQRLNIYEKKNKGDAYEKQRDDSERELFGSIEAKLQKRFLDNIHARPRYATFRLLSKNHSVEAASGYGSSYVVLQHRVKFNSIFVSCNSLAEKAAGRPLRPCTFHHFEIFLLYCTDEFLKALAQRITTGSLPKSFVCGAEVLLPSVNLLDPEFVESIYIKPSEHRLTAEELSALTSMGLKVINTSDNPYPTLNTELMQCAEKNQLTRAQTLLLAHPTLIRMTNQAGEGPLHIASKKGYSELVKLFIAHHADVNVRTTGGKAALHLAVASGSLETVQALCDAKSSRINIDIRMQSDDPLEDGMTPVYMASLSRYNSNNSAILNYLLEQKADLSLSTTNRATPLIIAAAGAILDQLQSIIAAGGNTAQCLSANAITIRLSTTAVTNAVAYGTAVGLRLVLAIPGLTVVNHKMKNGESALFMAASQGDLFKVLALLKFPGIDREAKRVFGQGQGDAKTAVQIATEKGHTTVVHLFNLSTPGSPYKALFDLFFTDLFFTQTEAALIAQLEAVKTKDFYPTLCRAVLDDRGLLLLVKGAFDLLSVLITAEAAPAASAWGIQHLTGLLKQNPVVEQIDAKDPLDHKTSAAPLTPAAGSAASPKRSAQNVGALITPSLLSAMQSHAILTPLWPVAAFTFARHAKSNKLAQELFTDLLTKCDTIFAEGVADTLLAVLDQLTQTSQPPRLEVLTQVITNGRLDAVYWLLMNNHREKTSPTQREAKVEVRHDGGQEHLLQEYDEGEDPKAMLPAERRSILPRSSASLFGFPQVVMARPASPEVFVDINQIAMQMDKNKMPAVFWVLQKAQTTAAAAAASPYPTLLRWLINQPTWDDQLRAEPNEATLLMMATQGANILFREVLARTRISTLMLLDEREKSALDYALQHYEHKEHPTQAHAQALMQVLTTEFKQQYATLSTYLSFSPVQRQQEATSLAQRKSKLTTDLTAKQKELGTLKNKPTAYLACQQQIHHLQRQDETLDQTLALYRRNGDSKPIHSYCKTLTELAGEIIKFYQVMLKSEVQYAKLFKPGAGATLVAKAEMAGIISVLKQNLIQPFSQIKLQPLISMQLVSIKKLPELEAIYKFLQCRDRMVQQGIMLSPTKLK